MRVPGVMRWLAMTIILLALRVPALSQGEGTPTRPVPPPPPAITEDTVRLLELGKLLMGQNNPAYALLPEHLSFEQRNQAGEQALRTFQAVVKREPRYAEGWLWLGIAYTQALTYSKASPRGKPVQTDAFINEGIAAFRMAYLTDPSSEDCVKYYGDALMEYRKDFDTALTLWNTFLGVAKTDLQRMTAYVQAARACLNKAYFGREAQQPAELVRQQYQQAVIYVQQATRLCPNARDVKEMQLLLQQHKRLAGK